MPTIGYFPYGPTARSAEAGWLGDHLSVAVRVAGDAPALNDGPPAPLPPLAQLQAAVDPFLDLPAVIAEGPAGFLWATLLRARGFGGAITILPYLNPRRWYDVAAIALYARFAHPSDRVFLGSTPSAELYRERGIDACVGEPYGIDDRLFRLRPGADRVREELGIGPGRVMLYAGRAEPDKDLHRLLRVGLKARLLFGDLQVVIASHVTDGAYMAPARRQLGDEGVHFVDDPSRDQLADLYNVADVFVTASTSHFETFGRAPAEALACGCPAVAPRYDGFAEVLAQPGGTLVDVELDPATGMPHAGEEQLLRAVYEVLSAPSPPPRPLVSAAAHRRFGRSVTIELLRDLVSRAGGERTAARERDDSALPAPWRGALAELDRRAPLDALAWFHDGCDHERLGASDDEFAGLVRRMLCVPRPGPRRAEAVSASCR